MLEKKSSRQTHSDEYLPLDFPKVNPVLAVKDYTQSKIEVHQIKYNPTTWEISRNSAQVHLLDAKQLLHKKSILLNRFRKVVIEKRQDFDKQWAQVEKDEETFKLTFKRYNRFVRENQEKRDRAEKKIADEIDLQNKRTLDISLMEEHFADVINIKNLMEKRLKEHKMYEDYLQGVVKSSSSFKNLNELLYRYESLIETKNILSEKQHGSLIALELARANMMKLIEEKTLVLVGLQNQLASLQERYDVAYGKSLQWESNVSKIQDICTHESTIASLVKHSINDTYIAMCRRKGIEPRLPADDFEGKLVFINKTLGDLKEILAKIKSVKREKRRS